VVFPAHDARNAFAAPFDLPVMAKTVSGTRNRALILSQIWRFGGKNSPTNLVGDK